MKTFMMNRFAYNLRLLVFLLLIAPVRMDAQDGLKRNNLFDSGWKFHLGGALGAEAPDFDDSQWRVLDLPHDWSIENLPNSVSPFQPNALSQVNGGFTTGGTGWYRKSFVISPDLKEKKFLIMFEGVYMNSDVWLNGEYIGNHPYGYTSFFYDISDKIRFDKENIIAVKVKNEGENSRWYSGSGIYRHVWLQVTSAVHLAVWGTSIITPVVNEKEALINVRTSIVNQGKNNKEVTVITTIQSAEGKEVAVSRRNVEVETGKTLDIVQDITIKNPQLWSTDTPVLYKAVSAISDSGQDMDGEETSFGIRSIAFDATNGFLLNGKSLKLKGGCVHNDNGILGSKAYDRAEERRVELLKSNGYNAIRSAHNPPSPAFLDACDRIGMLVIDEAFDMWREGKNPYDYHLYFNDWWKKDIESMVLRDRNHPSVIMWSIGNEIPDRQNPEVVETAQKLRDLVNKTDPTRPVTSAVNNLTADQDPFFKVLDIAGYNYASGGDHNQNNIYEADHKRMPGRIMVGTESYPLEAFSSWMDVIDHSYVIGDFVWTAYDYIGEASIGWRGYFQKQDFFPWNLAFCGDLDICGWKRAQSYYRDVLWNSDKLSIWVAPPQPSFPVNPKRESWSKWHWYDVLSDWNWNGDEGKQKDVVVYSSCAQTELFLNGKSLGKKTTDRSTEYMAHWNVPYEPGTIEAVGYSAGKRIASERLKTAEDAKHIRLSADKMKIIPDGYDLSYITVELTDRNGIINPKAENLISFQVEGPGSIIGISNANPTSLESFQLPFHKAWHGKCMVVIKSGRSAGKITVTVNSEGIASEKIDIESAFH
jgi:beta-galactosidase